MLKQHRGAELGVPVRRLRWNRAGAASGLILSTVPPRPPPLLAGSRSLGGTCGGSGAHHPCSVGGVKVVRVRLFVLKVPGARKRRCRRVLLFLFFFLVFLFSTRTEQPVFFRHAALPLSCTVRAKRFPTNGPAATFQKTGSYGGPTSGSTP